MRFSRHAATRSLARAFRYYKGFSLRCKGLRWEWVVLLELRLLNSLLETREDPAPQATADLPDNLDPGAREAVSGNIFPGQRS